MRDVIREAKSAMVTTAARAPKRIAVIPPTKIMGAKMHIVVIVDATTAVPTSPAPVIAPSVRDLPPSRCRWTLSRMTMALSTTIPMAIAREERVIWFMV